MTHLNLRLILAIVLLCGGACQAEQPAASAPTAFTADALREDFAALYLHLQSAHADLYAHRSKADYDARHLAMLGELTQPMSLFDASVFFQRFVAYGNVAHASIAFPNDTFEAFRDQGGRTLPIYLRIQDGRAYVGENYSGRDDIAAGDQITALNGSPIDQWLRRTAAHISADTRYIAHSMLEFTFPRYVWLELGEVATFTLTIRARNGKEEAITIKALSRDEQRENASSQPERFELNANERKAKRLEENIAYLRPGPFYNVENPAEIWSTTNFIAFIDDAFTRFIDAGAEHLIIDLRQNPGGDNSFSDPMLAWIANEPFRFCSAFLVRSSDEAAASNQARLDANPAAVEGVSEKFAQHYAKVPRGESFEFDIPLVTPRQDKRFEGQVIVLVNRHSYSNSVNVAAIVQDYGLGLVAGEKTADMATTYGAMESFRLNNTGIKVGFPKAHIIRPSGERRSDGVTPNWLIDTPIVASDKDVVLERLVQKIQHEKRGQTTVLKNGDRPRFCSFRGSRSAKKNVVCPLFYYSTERVRWGPGHRKSEP